MLICLFLSVVSFHCVCYDTVARMAMRYEHLKRWRLGLANNLKHGQKNRKIVRYSMLENPPNNVL